MLQDRIKISTEIFVNDELMEAIDIVTDGGVRSVASFLGSSSNSQEWMPYIAIGSGLTAPSTADSVLESELHRKLGTITILNNTYFIEATFGLDEPTGDVTIREVGLFNAYTGGTLGARWVFAYDLLKGDADNLVIKCAISFI